MQCPVVVCTELRRCDTVAQNSFSPARYPNYAQAFHIGGGRRYVGILIGLVLFVYVFDRVELTLPTGMQRRKKDRLQQCATVPSSYSFKFV